VKVVFGAESVVTAGVGAQVLMPKIEEGIVNGVVTVVVAAFVAGWVLFKDKFAIPVESVVVVVTGRGTLNVEFEVKLEAGTVVVTTSFTVEVDTVLKPKLKVVVDEGATAAVGLFAKMSLVPGVPSRFVPQQAQTSCSGLFRT